MHAYREITARGIALGVFQGVLMTAAFTYAGLKLGFGVGGSSVAAIMGEFASSPAHLRAAAM